VEALQLNAALWLNLRRRYGALCALIVLAVALHMFAQSGFKDLFMKKYPADNFFSGSMLEAARAIDRNDLVEMKKHLQGRDVNQKGAKEMSLLWYAIQTKKLSAVTELMKLGADPDRDGVQGLGMALNWALINYEGTDLLAAMLDGGLNPNTLDAGGGNLLQRAMTSGEWTLPKVKLLVERGADLNLRDSIGGSALWEAIEGTTAEVAVFLLERGADPNIVTTRGITPAYAVQKKLARTKLDSDLYRHLLRTQQLMQEKGARFPADPPAKVREWMKSQGMKVAE
jgi:uncharacterized protein